MSIWNVQCASLASPSAGAPCVPGGHSPLPALHDVVNITDEVAREARAVLALQGLGAEEPFLPQRGYEEAEQSVGALDAAVSLCDATSATHVRRPSRQGPQTYSALKGEHKVQEDNLVRLDGHGAARIEGSLACARSAAFRRVLAPRLTSCLNDCSDEVVVDLHDEPPQAPVVGEARS